jgi:hypothetical protein
MPRAALAFHITGASVKVQLFTRQLLQYAAVNAKVQLFSGEFHQYAAVNAKVQLFGSWEGKYAPCASNNCTFAG